MTFRGTLFQVRKGLSAALALVAAVAGFADQFLPAVQGLMPPLVYAGVAIFLALLPSILDRREHKR